MVGLERGGGGRGGPRGVRRRGDLWRGDGEAPATSVVSRTPLARRFARVTVSVRVALVPPSFPPPLFSVQVLHRARTCFVADNNSKKELIAATTDTPTSRRGGQLEKNKFIFFRFE